MFDTHCHLNFKAFEENLEIVIADAAKAGVTQIIIPGTDISSSKKAVEISRNHKNIYASVGIHPHHVFQAQSSNFKSQIHNLPIKTEVKEIERLLNNKKVVAVGEVGVDRHYYKNTKYANYQIDESFIKLQKELLASQIELALRYEKSLILHNWDAKDDLLEILRKKWEKRLEGSTVFHCCEPDKELLNFAVSHDVFIGVDGDVTYDKKKQSFVKNIPLDHLVFETDSPYLTPEPVRSKRKFPNEPKNLTATADFLAKLVDLSIDRLIEIADENSRRLFQID